MSAEFKVIFIDDFAEITFDGPIGTIVTDARRCCENCSLVLGSTPGYGIDDKFLFGHKELEPMNLEAEAIVKRIQIHMGLIRPPTIWDRILAQK